MRTAALVFDEYPDDEMVVRISPVATNDYFDVLGLSDGATWSRDSLESLFTAFAPFIESWTFPEPVDVPGLMARDATYVIAAIRQWAKAVREVPLPLPLPSSGSTTSALTSPSSSTEPDSSTTS